MLRGTLTLWDVRDVEAFCAKAIDRSGITEFGYLDQEDLLSELITFCWQLGERYDSQRASFSSFAGGCLYNFIIEWKRSDFRTKWSFGDGRVYERVRPVFVEHDGNVGEAAVDPAERSDSVDEWVDPEGSIGAAAYFPPRHLSTRRGIYRAPSPKALREEVEDCEAA